MLANQRWQSFKFYKLQPSGNVNLGNGKTDLKQTKLFSRFDFVYT